MKVIFHVGMGKTGTSSIQAAMDQNSESLKAQNVRYLGMWFDFLDDQFHGLSGTRRFLSQSPSELVDYAKVFAKKIADYNDQDGSETFVLSNESLFQRPEAFLAFANALKGMKKIETQVVIYLRNPSDWIGSAYAQWGVNHKTKTGRIPTMEEFAPELLGQYDEVRAWMADCQVKLNLRLFEKKTDVVADFARAADMKLEPLKKRHLERKEPAEMVLRREFNNLFKQQVLPQVFDEAVVSQSTLRTVESIEDIVESIFSSEAGASAIEERSDLWKLISEELGSSFATSGSHKKQPNSEEVRSRLLDYLVVLTMQQSKRLYGLELMLKNKQ